MVKGVEQLFGRRKAGEPPAAADFDAKNLCGGRRGKNNGDQSQQSTHAHDLTKIGLNLTPNP